MKIRANTYYGREVFIVQFVCDEGDCLAVTVDSDGDIYTYKISELTVIDDEYLR